MIKLTPKQRHDFVAYLNSKGLRPRRTETYTEPILNNHIRGLSFDPQIEKEIGGFLTIETYAASN